MGRLLSLTLLALLAVMWLVLAFSTNSFWTYNNISNLLRQGSMIAILAMGETFVIITAGIDLSVGAVVGFTSVIVAWLLTHGFPIWASILITLLLGFGIGTFHGFGITKLGLPPFIMTLATLTALRGIGLLMTNGATISYQRHVYRLLARRLSRHPQSLLDGGGGGRAGLHFSASQPLWAISVRDRLEYGGGPPFRVNTTRMIYIAYILSAVCASFVGILLASRIGIGNATKAEGWELQAIASSVIGGTSLFGAVGSVHGPLLGSFILTTINNGANLLNVNAFWQRIITGVLIIVIVYFDGLRAKKR